MAFDSFNAFLAMGTHGPYVWSSYGITAFMLIGIIIQTIMAKKQQIKNLRNSELRVQRKNASS